MMATLGRSACRLSTKPHHLSRLLRRSRLEQATHDSKHREETTKMRLLFALAGLAIGFAVPALAQEQNTVDPEVRQQIEALIVKFDDGYNMSDAAAIADLFTQDGASGMGVGDDR